MTEFFKHAIDFTDNNLNKLKGDAQTALKAVQIGTGMDVHFAPNNHKRIMKAYKSGCGVRIKLTQEEKEHNMSEGTGLGQFLHSIGIKNGVRKLKNTGKMIARSVLPTLGAMAGDALGIATANPELAPIGSLAGNVLASSPGLQNGNGLFRTLHKMGISKKQVMKIGKSALHAGVNTVANKVASDPNASSFAKNMAVHATNIAHAGIDGNKADLIQAGKSALSDNLPQARNLIHDAVLHHTGNADLAGNVADFAHSTAVDAINQSGEGIRWKKPKPIEYKTGERKFHRVLGGEIDSSFNHGYSSMLPSNAPAMHPFVEYDSPYQPSLIVPKSNAELKRRIKGGSFV